MSPTHIKLLRKEKRTGYEIKKKAKSLAMFAAVGR